MMKNEFVPYEEALALKVLGYSEFKTGIKSFGFYCEGVFYPLYRNHQDYQPEHIYREVDAPLYQQAFRWFREEYDWINPTRQLVFILDKTAQSDNPMSYEEAELACLRKLIEIINQNKDDNKENQRVT